MGVGSSFELQCTFLLDLLPKVVKKPVPLGLIDLSNDLFSSFTGNKLKPGIMTPTGLPEEAVQGF